MVAYHAATPASADYILRHGLNTSSRGDKGSSPDIAHADTFLDAHRPQPLVQANVSRLHNAYAYVAVGADIIDITDGNQKPLPALQTLTQCFLRLELDPHRCYVSDLDLFDQVRQAVTTNQPAAIRLAQTYWQQLQPLSAFTIGTIRRPEIMITYHVPPTNLSRV